MTRYPFETFISGKLRLIAARGSVLDIGGGEPLSKWLKPYRSLFAGVAYRSFDYDARTGADVVGDIHAIPLPDDSVDAIICASVLEHVRDPLRAMAELRRILKPGGAIFFYVPSIYPYHARKGAYPDVWRFFDDTIQVLFEGFSRVDVAKRGGYFLALSFFVPGQHRARRVLDLLAWVLDTTLRTEGRNTTAGYYVYAEK